MSSKSLLKISAAVLLSLPLLSSCVSMSERYAAAKKTVDISQDQLRSKDDRDYAGAGQWTTIKGDTPQAGSQAGPIMLKVLIKRSKVPFKLTSASDINLSWNGAAAARSYEFSAGTGGIDVNGEATGQKKISVSSASRITCAGKDYRGSFIVYLNGDGMLAVNSVELEEYLYGVLPCEVSPGWEPEVLKAQAVAARTFALYGRLKNTIPEYDLDSGVLSQVYKGYSVESRPTNDAIDATAGEVLTYNGELIQSFFHANSGGRTASSAEVWGGSCSYLQSVGDSYSAGGKGYRWDYAIPASKVGQILEKNGIKCGSVVDLYADGRTESGRVMNVKVNGTSGNFQVKAKDLRMWLGPDQMKSTNFEVKKSGESFRFEGYGWGHGVGMSQEGARQMADEGRTYRDILRHYYRDTRIKKIKVEK